MTPPDRAPWPEPIGIIGAGAVGVALARALVAAEIPIIGVGVRDAARVAAEISVPLLAITRIVADAGTVILAVPDDVIVPVARAYTWRAGQWVIHCAGSQPAALLAEAAAPAAAGAWHPLAAFARPGSGPPPTISPFVDHIIAIDGDEAVSAGLAALARALGGTPLTVPPEARAIYHLAAVLTSAGIVTALAEARVAWQVVGLDPALALPALLPLAASTVGNLERIGLPDALSGPVARGDVATVARHLAALAAQPDLAEPAAYYRQVTKSALEIAAAQGHATSERLAEIRRLISEE
jgi:predicted short-subunit dehydrogenase-like oxidoreductase (DUF2520 family)